MIKKEEIKSNKNKKAQITVYIIIAIVVVVLLVLVLIFSGDKTTGAIESEQSKLELVPVQVRPVYLYMDDILKNIVEDGLEILRLQGGYIYLPFDVELIDVETQGKHVKHNGSEIKIIKETGKTKIPLWIDTDEMAMPSLLFMEDQLELYIEDRFSKIDLIEFENQGMDVSQGLVDANVFLENKVRVLVDYPIDIDLDDQAFTFEEFSQTVDINFNGLYNILSDLVAYELSHYYLENHAQSLISLYSYAGGEKRERILPPLLFTDTNLNGRFVIWSYSEVQDSLSSIFEDNFKYIKMDKTNFERTNIERDPMAQGIYDSFIYDYFPEMDNIHIDFSYNPENNLELEMNPSRLIPDRVSQTKIPYLPRFDVFKYNFRYTIKTPIIVKVSDDMSTRFSEQGYEFYFPIKLFICNNEERICPEIQDYVLDLGSAGIDLKLYDCEDTESQKTITITDSNQNALENVDVAHYCEGYANNCWLGQTDSTGEIIINLPKCESPTLELTKTEYQTLIDEIKKDYVLNKIENYTLEVMLVKANEFAAAHFLTNGFRTDSCGGTPDSLFEKSLFMPQEDDKIMIMGSNINGANNILASYPLDKKIAFAGGNYKLNTIVQSDVVIEPSYIGDSYISFNEEDNEEPYEGQWVLGIAENEFIIDPSELQGKDTITIYALVEHLSSEELTVEKMQNALMDIDGISGEINADSDCDGVKETLTVNLPKSNYNNFIKPKFTKKI